MEEEEPVATFTASPVTPDPGWEQTDGEMTEYTYNEYGEIVSRVVYMWFYEPGPASISPWRNMFQVNSWMFLPE